MKPSRAAYSFDGVQLRALPESIRWPMVDSQHSWAILSRLSECLRRAQLKRVRNLLLVGDPVSGKSTLLQMFCRAMPVHDLPTGGIRAPVLRIRAPKCGTLDGTYDALLNLLFAPIGDKTRESKSKRIIQLFRYARVGMLVIDDIDRLLVGSRQQYTETMDALLMLVGITGIPLVAACSTRSYQAIHAEPRIDGMFDTIAIPTWTYGFDFLRFLSGLERAFPDNSGRICDPTISVWLHNASKGNTGYLSYLVGTALARVCSFRGLLDLRGLKDLPKPTAARVRALMSSSGIGPWV